MQDQPTSIFKARNVRHSRPVMHERFLVHVTKISLEIPAGKGNVIRQRVYFGLSHSPVFDFTTTHIIIIAVFVGYRRRYLPMLGIFKLKGINKLEPRTTNTPPMNGVVLIRCVSNLITNRNLSYINSLTRCTVVRCGADSEFDR